MAKNLRTQKVIQVSEESAPAMHIPLIVGNEIYVLTQQDIRRVEDIRLLTYNRLSAQGHILNGLPPSVDFPNFYCANINRSVPNPVDLLAPPIADPCDLDPEIQFPNLFSQCCQENRQQNPMHFIDDELEMEPIRTVANIATQMETKKVQTSSPFPLHYSVGTSTCGLTSHQNADHQRPARKERHHSSCQTDAITACVACNTDDLLQGEQPQKCAFTKEAYVSAINCRCCTLNKECNPSSSQEIRNPRPKVRINDSPPICLPNFG